MRRAVLLAALIIVVTRPPGATAAAAAYRVDPAKSRATIHVGKAGAFSFIAGHSHEISGPIQTGTVDVDVDNPSRSRIELTIASSELKVSVEKEPAGDAPKVQEAMESEKVLDVRRYPKITYESGNLTVKNRRGNVLELSITGRLTIRDLAQEVTAPVHVELAEHGLTATGRFEVRQTAFGIKPISVGGVVAVKDALGIEFSLVASK